MTQLNRLQLAQFNYARARFAPEDRRMAAFIDALDDINRLADQAPGFIWRYQTEKGHTIDTRPFPDDPLKLITLSTWTDVEALRAYVYRSAHAGYLRRRDAWFEPADGDYLVLWWRPFGPPPTVAEGMERLEQLRRLGPTPTAFNMSALFDATGAPRRTPRPVHP